MADDNQECIPGLSQLEVKSSDVDEDDADDQANNQQQQQPNQQYQQQPKNTFDDISLTTKEEISTTPSSCSSQDLRLSGSSTPLGTPINASNENLIMKDITLLGGGDDFDDGMSSVSGGGPGIERFSDDDGSLRDLRAMEAKYEEKIKSISDEKKDLEKQIQDLKGKIRLQEDQFGKTIEDIKLTFNSRLEKCAKERDMSRKDLESMVVKYAKSERDVIMSKKAKDDAEKKLRDAQKEKESLQTRVKNLTCDKTSITKLVDTKLAENCILQKELEKVKDELKDRDLKWKQAQNKLKVEIEDHQETCKKLSEALTMIDELQTKIANPVGDTSNSQDSTIKEKNVGAGGEDDTCKLDSDGTTKSDEVKMEFKNLKDKCSSLESENHALTRKIQALERERLDHEEVVSKLKESLNKLNSDMLESNMKLRDMEELKVCLQREKEMMENTKNELARVTELNNELTAEMDSCRHKEGELLEFTERLTAKSVLLQSEHNALEEKYSNLLQRYESLEKQFESLQSETTSLKETLSKERDEHEKEITLMARKVAEKSEIVIKYKTKMEEMENENKVMKKRHLNSIRELNKELLVMKRHMETCENGLEKKDNTGNGHSDTVSNSSRSSSSSHDAASSVSTFTNVNKPGPSSSVVGGQSNDVQVMNGTLDADCIPHVDKQMLINKIFRLQKTIAKKQEKVDFLEEHNHQLQQEMKKKTKLIQYYILREEAGALTTNRMDENKKQLAKHGSTVMSSLYKSYASDSAMTLTLSLEINRRLQAVLEDTILKNITLKDNLNTLGEEIAKLMQQKSKASDHGASANSVSIG